MCSTATCICGALCKVIAGEDAPNVLWWESWERRRCGVAQTNPGGIMVGLFPSLFGGMAYWRIKLRLLGERQMKIYQLAVRRKPPGESWTWPKHRTACAVPLQLR